MNGAHALPAELTIYTVGEWYPHCRSWAGGDDADALVLDATAVQEVDAAGVQLMLSLANALAQRGRRLLIAEPSAALAAACTVLGVTHLFAEATAETTP